jgi:hypothetical protein
MIGSADHGAAPPGDAAPFRLLQHGLDRDRSLARHGLLARSPSARHRPEQLDRAQVDVLGLQDTDGPSEASCAQALAEGGARPVAGVRQHAAEADAGSKDPVDLGKCNVRLRQGAAVLLGHPGPGAALPVGDPLIRQEQPQPDRQRRLIPGQGERDQDLAVRLFAQGAAILPGHTDRVLALLRTRGVVDHQHGTWATNQRVRLPGQDPPQRRIVPGRAGNEVLQRIVAAQPEPHRERLPALAAVRTE